MNEVTIDQICDELGEIRARLDALEAPRSQGDAAGAHFAKTPDNDCCFYEGNQCLHVDSMIAERDATYEALRKYGQHMPHCPAQIAKYVPMGACTCGLTAALDTGAS